MTNVATPLFIDAAAEDWPIARADGVLCVNMAHISPWRATAGLMAGASQRLGAGAPLLVYGPFRRAGVPTAASNEAFDQSLKARDPEWGLRDVEAMHDAAAAHLLKFEELVEMPANNLVLVYRRAG